MAIPPTIKAVYTSYDDFVNSLDDDESAELSHLNLPDNSEISRERINFQLALAEKKFMSYFGLTVAKYVEAGAPAELSGNLVTCTVALARKRLDYLNPREEVINDAQACYDLAMRWRDDDLEKKKLDKDDGVIDPDEAVMSIFTI